MNALCGAVSYQGKRALSGTKPDGVLFFWYITVSVYNVIDLEKQAIYNKNRTFNQDGGYGKGALYF